MFDSPQHNEPQPVEVKGRSLHCQVCGNDRFWVRSAQLNRQITTFFNLDWTDRSATCLVCSDCTYIHWFMGESS